MTKIKSMVYLDYMAMKSYFTIKYLFVFGALALIMTISSEGIKSVLCLGLMIATLLVGYPFLLSEKSNLDSLYTTLSVKKKTVVQGRYIFTVLLNIGTILFALIFAVLGRAIAKTVGILSDTGSGGYMVAVLVLAVLFILIQAVQLPIFFKIGYMKGRFISLVPFVALMAGFIAFGTIQNDGQWAESFEKLAGHGFMIPVLVVVLIIIVLLSYGLSVAFYRKREF